MYSLLDQRIDHNIDLKIDVEIDLGIDLEIDLEIDFEIDLKIDLEIDLGISGIDLEIAEHLKIGKTIGKSAAIDNPHILIFVAFGVPYQLQSLLRYLPPVSARTQTLTKPNRNPNPTFTQSSLLDPLTSPLRGPRGEAAL